MSFLSYLNPTPTFPAYSGPYQVGSHDVEIPTAELSTNAAPPDPQVTTVQFRLFYPCQRDSKSQESIRWLPDDQFEYLKAYYAFMQAKPWLNSVLTWATLLRLVQFATIPAKRDGKLLQGPATNGGRWPVMFFSHGLGGSRNAYSHICGSLASHGLVVVAPEHRDGSAPLSFVRDSEKATPTRIPYRYYPHESTPEVEKGRNDQLKIRCWELGLIHEALLKMDTGYKSPPSSAWKDVLDGFKGQLDVHRPGKISWTGHSFGASTVVQFVKSVYHGGSFLFPKPSESLRKQIQPASPVSLLDLWAMPLSGPTTASLYKTPLPAYCGKPASPPLAILSIGFYKWTTNFQHTLSTILPPSSSDIKPIMFYPSSSAHLSQSDFGVLFPWVTKKVMKAEEPERTLKLNTRAIVESLRCSGIVVANTSAADMEIDEPKEGQDDSRKETVVHDHAILAAEGDVRGWVPLDVDAERKRLGIGIGTGAGSSVATSNEDVKEPEDAVMKYEIMNEGNGSIKSS